MAATEQFARVTTLAMFDPSDTATMENDATKAILEALVDRFTLPVILSALAEVCGDKAAHIEESWQDATMASSWRTSAHKLDSLALKL